MGRLVAGLVAFGPGLRGQHRPDQTAFAGAHPLFWARAAPQAAAGGPARAIGSWPTDLAIYLIIPILILVVAHYVIAYALDVSSAYLQVVAVAVPFCFGFLLSWLAGRGAATAVAIAVTLGVVAVSGMTLSDGLNSGQPILPETRVEWRDNIVFAVSIALSFVAGHALIPVGTALRRKIRKI
jgi:hypothetical protein